MIEILYMPIEDKRIRGMWSDINIQILSESFIEKYKDKVDWTCILRYQTLSETFIEKHQDKND